MFTVQSVLHSQDILDYSAKCFNWNETGWLEGKPEYLLDGEKCKLWENST